MKPINHFLDIAFFSTSNIEEYRSERLFSKLIQFNNRVNEIENHILPEGDRRKIIKIPMKRSLIYQCYIYPPSRIDTQLNDTQLRKSFNRIFSIIQGKYMVDCNIEFECIFEEIYTNNLTPSDIEEDFNNFLDGCIKSRSSLCVCENIMKNTPIFITERTILSNNINFTSFNNPDDLKKYFQILNFYPSIEDNIKIKEKLFRFMIEIFLIKKNIDIYELIEQNDMDEESDDPLESKIKFLEAFWESEWVFINDQKFRMKIIEVVSNLIENPSSLANRLHQLDHENIIIEGNRKKLNQIDIFQEYRIGGSEIYPRLLFTTLEGKIYLYKIINRH